MERSEGAGSDEAFHLSGDQDWIEARYAEAQSLARMGSWEIDLETSVAEWSPGLRALVGLGPDDPPLDLAAYQERVHEDDRERGQDDMVRLLRDGRAFDSDHRFWRLDGSLRHFQAHARCELGPDGQRAARLRHDAGRHRPAAQPRTSCAASATSPPPCSAPSATASSSPATAC